MLPKEHGSWSLALEPLVLALCAAPSWAGVALSAAVFAAFLARRPLQATLGPRAAAKTSGRPVATVIVLGACALLSTLLAGWWGGFAALAALAPAAGLGAVFLWFDLRGGGREQTAELVGAAAFAGVPMGVAALAGWSWPAAGALAAVMLARLAPTVLVVRVYLRRRKGEAATPWIALLASGAAVAVGVLLAAEGRAPRLAVVLLGFLFVRALGLLIWPRPEWRATRLGIAEAVIGAVFAVGVGLAWMRP